MQIQNYQPPIETGRWNNIDCVNRICTKHSNVTIELLEMNTIT